ncbi:hypothetical protein ElyMa_003875100 [Elysia marginata]|uniref:Uncharacterized protein n=1 Tax=Elysia marginata TaxID=1093978 RepID=A0AAV4FKA2_9GAST|nr:hypothetical protein ElyMa_003875100 [Elysia marginata]
MEKVGACMLKAIRICSGPLGDKEAEDSRVRPGVGRYDSDDAVRNSDDGGSDTDDDGGIPMMTLVTTPMTMVVMIEVHRQVQLVDQGCRNVRPSKSKALGLWKCAVLHGRRTTKASRPHTPESLSGSNRCRLTASKTHTHGSLSGYSRCRLTASQYRRSTTAKRNSTVRQVPVATGFLSHKQ